MRYQVFPARDDQNLQEVLDYIASDDQRVVSVVWRPALFGKEGPGRYVVVSENPASPAPGR